MGTLAQWSPAPAPGFPFSTLQGSQQGFFIRPFGAVVSQAAALNRLYLTPLILGEPKAFNEVGANITVAAAAGGVCRLGLYKADGANRRPKTLLEDFGAVAADTVGLKTIALGSPIGPLAAGLYWAALVAQVAASSAEGITGLSGLLFRSGAGGISSGWFLDGVEGALPAGAEGLGSAIQNSPSPAFRMTT